MSNYKKAEDISPSMCIMPWIGVATDPSGGIRPCCWMQAITPNKFRGNPAEYKDSKYLKDTKAAFLRGEYPDICARCKHDDARGMQTKRTRENRAWEEEQGGDWNKIDEQEFTMVDLRLSNVCNLGCVMCGPKSSSYILKESETYGELVPKHNLKQYETVKGLNIDLLNPYTDDQIDEIIDIIPSNARIYCTGGEPSLVKKTTQLLETLLAKGYNETVTLQFNSNFQTLNKKWFDLLEHFKGDMLPSLDGVGATAEYVRYPCDWNKVESNLKSFINQCGNTWTVKIMPTVSIASIFGFKEMWKWWYEDMRSSIPIIDNVYKEKLKNPAMRVQVNNRLISPEYFDIRNLPNLAKQKAEEDINFIIETYGKYFQVGYEKRYLTDVKNQLALEPNKEFSEAVDALERFDHIRGTSWRESLPELARYTNA